MTLYGKIQKRQKYMFWKSKKIRKTFVRYETNLFNFIIIPSTLKE